MNLILLFDNDFIDDSNVIRLSGRRYEHIKKIIKASPGDTLKIGRLNDKTGTGLVTFINDAYVELEISLNAAPPLPVPVTLIIALPRPKVLKRVIQAITSIGVKKIMLINAWRVEKSFWQSPTLNPETLKNQMTYGLEQSKDTVLPEIQLFKGFKPFVEDRLPEIVKGTLPLLAHPIATDPCPRNLTENVTLAIGPEGGFIPYEIDKLTQCGFKPIHMGDRILKVETAIPVILGKLF